MAGRHTRRGSALGSLDPPGSQPQPSSGLDLNDPAVHEVTIHSDSDNFALAGGAKRVPMSTLSRWCNVPPERANDIIILTDPLVDSSISVNFIGVDITVYGAMVAGYDKYAFFTAEGVVYNMAFGYDAPACDSDLGMIYPFGDGGANTLTIEPKEGMQIAIFNVSSMTADPKAQTVPRKPVLAASQSISNTVTSPPGPGATTNEINAGDTGNAKHNGPPIEAIVAPAVILGMCIIAGLILLYVFGFKRRKIGPKKLYGPIDWEATGTRPTPPMRERERNPEHVPLPPSIAGSNYSGSSSRRNSTDRLVQPYLLVQDSRAPGPPPKAALADLSNKRPARAYPLPTPGSSSSNSRHHHHHYHLNAQKASVARWKAGVHPHTPLLSDPAGSSSQPVSLEERDRLVRSISLASSTPSGTRDPRTLAALEQAVRQAGFSTQALLESLNRVREGRVRDESSVLSEEDGLPTYRR